MRKKIVRRDMPANCGEFGNFHPILQKIYAARDIHSSEDLNRDLEDLLSYSSFKDIEVAAERIASAMEDDEHILIVGDFDADGATSTTLAVNCLTAMGAKHVDFIVPNRFDFGYGLTPEIVEVAAKRKPDLIITVDNGISSIAGVDRANALGIDVVVTDHHLSPSELPKAHSIVNPNQPGDEFASKSIAGVGVIFYVMLAVRAQLKDIGWFHQRNIASPNMASYLDLVALGTVADVVVLDKNNRILVHQGMRRIQAGFARPGILALLDIARRNRPSVVAADLGYAIGPRLNAAGRLDDMSLGIACLLAEDYLTARKIAEELDQLNHERRAIETQMRDEAFGFVDKLDLENNLPMGICLFEKNWHQGVVGLVASRVKEKLHLPTIAFALEEGGKCLKGSARSIKGLHIRDALSEIAIDKPYLISKFGGHAMAAGLSIEKKHFTEFSQAFADYVAKKLGQDDLERKLESDGELDVADFSLELAQLLRSSGPWGQGFPEPLFDGNFIIAEQRLVGEKHLKLTLQLPNCQYFLDAIAFNIDLRYWPNMHCRNVHLAYRLDVNEYRGRRKLQLIVEHLEPLKQKEQTYAASAAAA